MPILWWKRQIREIGERLFHICSKCHDEIEIKELRQQKLLQLNNDEEFMNNRFSVLRENWMKEYKEKHDRAKNVKKVI